MPPDADRSFWSINFAGNAVEQWRPAAPEQAEHEFKRQFGVRRNPA